MRSYLTDDIKVSEAQRAQERGPALRGVSALRHNAAKWPPVFAVALHFATNSGSQLDSLDDTSPAVVCRVL